METLNVSCMNLSFEPFPNWGVFVFFHPLLNGQRIQALKLIQVENCFFRGTNGECVES